MSEASAKSLFDSSLSESVIDDAGLTKTQVDALFEFFKNHPLFKWDNSKNDCEDRSNAICILLDHWKIPNYKGWVFSGNFLKRTEGNLLNYWNFHVAPLLSIHDGDA